MLNYYDCLQNIWANKAEMTIDFFMFTFFGIGGKKKYDNERRKIN